MFSRRVKSTITFITISLIFIAIFVTLPFVIYLKVLPWAVSNDKVISYVEDLAQKSLMVNVDIEKPVLKTGMNPYVYFDIDTFKMTDQKKNVLLDIENLKSEFSFEDLKNKNIIVKKITLDNIFADVNKVLDMPIFKQEQKETKPCDWSVDIFQSVLAVKNAKILYKLDKKTMIKVLATNVKIDDNPNNKGVFYNVVTDITKGKSNLHIVTYDNNAVLIKDKSKIVINNSPVFVNKSKLNVNGFVDNKMNYNIGLSSENFQIPNVLKLLDSQIVENNISEQLVYFKDIDGSFDFNIRATNKSMNGLINVDKASLKIIPLANLPVLVNQGKVYFDSNNVTLKGFKGYYNNKPSNKMDFSGTVKDYLKSVDTDLVGNAVVTNDFATNYLSKMLGYPMGIKGQADTKIKLKSKYNKIDLEWLYWFKKGNGFITDGEESVMNDAANRVLAAKMHFENMILNVKSIDYYAWDKPKNKALARIPLLSLNANIDFSNGKTFVQDFGLELPKPMPSGFLNVLMKQRFFKKGTFIGKLKVVNTGKYPVVVADMKADSVAIPSQRMFIKSGSLRTEGKYIYINSEGRYRRSAYSASGTLVNEIKLPVIVKNITLSLDTIDVEKYLRIFNNQQPSDHAADNVQDAIAKSVENNTTDDEDADDDAQTFDLANIIIEECILKVNKGFYKDIKFSNAVANMSLDKNSDLKITSNKFDIAEGYTSAKIDCDLKKHKYNIWLALVNVNSDIMATSLLNLPKEINGKASGLLELNTDDSLKLNGRIQFRVYKGIIAKVGLVQYALNVASLFRNPLTMISPTVISDLVSIPEGRFDQIDGDLLLKNNVVERMMIKSSAPQLSSFIVGSYDLETQDAALRIYTKFSGKNKGALGFLRNISLNSLANRMSLSSNNDSNYYAAEISQLPPIDANEDDCQIFLTKVDGDVVQNNFISSLKKIK